MAIVRPFRAVRPTKENADKVVSLPYDVMNRKEAAEMAGENSESFLHICRSEIDLPDVENPYCEEVYHKAKNNIEQFLQRGTLIREHKPMLYIYRQIMDGRVQTGIVGCVAVDDYQNNVIKKHEFTRVEKELDRINHFDTCNANTEPVFLTYRKDDKISDTVNQWICEHNPEFDFVSEDGISHTLWGIDNDQIIVELTEAFQGIDALYIADGHHRSASAAKVGMKRREANPNFTGEEEFNYFMAVIFPDQDLKIFDYNRVVKDLNGLSKEEFLNKVSEKFDIQCMGADMHYPKAKHAFSMYLDHCWYELLAKSEIINHNDIIESLDVSILQKHLLDPILGIEDPRTDKRIDFVGGIRGLEGLEKRVQEDMEVAFALYPVDIADLLAVSDHDMVMPPKSTWFEPKLGSGLFIHEL